MTLLAKFWKSPLMYTMVPEVSVFANQSFRFLVRYLCVKEFIISIARDVGDEVNALLGTKILFRDLLSILGVRALNNNNLLVISVLVVVLTLRSKSADVVVVVSSVVVVVVHIVAGQIGLGGLRRQWG